MFTRIRIVLVCALLTAMFATVSVFAKGGFAFITISGADLKETLRTTHGELTRDFFAFADFYRNKSDAPADPGIGYEITRYYVDNSREVAFDQLHYYPETGFVFYDGIVSGSSEYDGKWYTANAAIKTAFEHVLPEAAWIAPSSNEPVEQRKSDQSSHQTKSNQPMSMPQFGMPVVVMASLIAVALIFILARRQRVVR
jgi:hypothetical protein